MEHEARGGAVIARVQPLRQGTNLDPLVVKLLDRFESFPEVPGQAIKLWDHHCVPGPEQTPEFCP